MKIKGFYLFIKFLDLNNLIIKSLYLLFLVSNFLRFLKYVK